MQTFVAVVTCTNCVQFFYAFILKHYYKYKQTSVAILIILMRE